MRNSLMNLLRPKWKNSDGWVRREAVKRISAQKKLVAIAQTDTDAEVRMAAAARLTDTAIAQQVFSDIAKNSSLWCEEAISKVTDQTLLADIAKTASSETIRMAATASLTDKALAQTMFSDIAKNDILDRTKAISKVTDQALLADIAKTASRGRLRLAAAARLTDKALAQSVFFDIAQHDAFEEVRTEAAYDLTDKAMIASLAMSANDENARLAAVQKIKDQSLLADIAKTPSNGKALLAALEKIADQTLLADVAQKAYSAAMRLAAAKKLTDKALAQTIFADIAEKNQMFWQQGDEAVQLLTDQGLLAEVAKSGTTSKVRLQVAEKLTDKDFAQKIFADIAKNETDCPQVVEKLIDQALLADVAKTARSGGMRLAVAWKLTDKALAQRIFADIAIAEPWGSEQGGMDGTWYSVGVGEKAFRELTDMNLLGEVAATAKDRLVRMAAAKKLTGPPESDQESGK